MIRVVRAGACVVLMLLAACGRPDTQALKKLACEQVASTIDLQSVGQVDALRKALGVAPGMDPITTCRSLGVTMEPGSQGNSSGKSGKSEDAEEPRTGSNGGET